MKMNMFHISSFLLLFIVASGYANECTDACNVRYPLQSNSSVTWCGSDNNTYTSAPEAIQFLVQLGKSDCYSVCNITVKHAGRCGCPNDCYIETGNGVCNTQLAQPICACAIGWKGADCSAVDCNGNNTCSGHGLCLKQATNKGDDYCKCDEGYTGYDCSIRVPDHFQEVPFGALPYGEISTPDPYYATEPNGDQNPMFNISRMATVKITIDDKDFAYQIDARNRRDVKYVNGKMFFDNGIVQTYQSVKFRIKGFSSRMIAKKNWNIKFDKAWNNVMGFSLKCGPNDRIITFPLVSELYRAMKAETYRVSFATLHVNGFYYGAYMMHERLDEQFMQSRWGVEDKNMYQISTFYYGEYLGSTPVPYQTRSTNIFDEVAVPVIEQQVGNGNWDDWVLLISLMNCTHLGVPFVEQHMDYSSFIRTTSVDMFTDNVDSYYGTGNNWIIANIGDSNHPHWLSMPTDYDNAFQSSYKLLASILKMSEAQVEYLITSGAYKFLNLPIDVLAFTLHPNPYVIINLPNRPLGSTVYQIPNALNNFTEIMTDLVWRVVFQNPGRVQARRQAFYEMTKTMVHRDKMFLLPGLFLEGSYEFYENAYSTLTPAWINKKFSYLASMFVAKGHGKCDALGNCVCDVNYSGVVCEIYTPPPPTSAPTVAPCAASVSLVQGNTWMENNVQHAQYDLTVTNSGSLDLTAVSVAFSGNTIASKWNMELVGEDYELDLWNAVAPGQSASSYGFIAVGNNTQQASVASVACN